MKKEKEKRIVSIPAEIYDRIDERVKTTGFDSVDEYVIFVLAEVLKDEGDEGEVAFTKEEEAEVKKRLKALGYLK